MYSITSQSLYRRKTNKKTIQNKLICTTFTPSTTNIIIGYHPSTKLPIFSFFYALQLKCHKCHFGEQNMLLSDYSERRKNNTSNGTNRQRSSKVAKAKWKNWRNRMLTNARALVMLLNTHSDMHTVRHKPLECH